MDRLLWWLWGLFDLLLIYLIGVLLWDQIIFSIKKYRIRKRLSKRTVMVCRECDRGPCSSARDPEQISWCGTGAKLKRESYWEYFKSCK